MAENVLITGGTGLIGRRLTEILLQEGFSVSHLSRSGKNLNGKIKTYHWNPAKAELDDESIQHADYIINLAGSSIADGRWTAKRKEEICNSRVAGARLLAGRLKKLNHPLKAFISASAVGYYGDTGSNWLDEEQLQGSDFLARVCAGWESESLTIAGLGIRTVICRIGIVLAREGGALPEMEKSMRFGVAAYLGSGEQYYSWIHIEDLCRIFLYAIKNEKMSGVFNAVGNNPVTNKELVAAIKQAKGARICDSRTGICSENGTG